MPDKKIFTVTELTKSIKTILRTQIGFVCVEGEISNLRYAPSGHCYMTLKDASAQIKLVMFRSFLMTLKFKLEDGQKVIVSGEVSIYEKSSEYQLIANYIEPLGVGSLQLAFEQLKEKLEKQGLFDIVHKKALPYMPFRVGVVTSPTGSVIRDILNVTRRRSSVTSILLNPVRVQGEGAKLEIAEAIDLFNDLKNVDVIIVARGGGSIEDLWPFNEEIVARAIYRSEIPVVSAVGHETDFTISDFVSDLRASTPSAAAELVVPDVYDLKQDLISINKSMYNLILNKLEFYRNKIKGLLSHYVFKESEGLIKFYFQRIDDLSFRLKNNIKVYLKENNSKFKMLSQTLDVLSPLKVIGRGYSICFKQGKIVKSVKDVKICDKIETKVSDGVIISEVKG
jgi:exodeoxyribonuclease VII large subunit